MLIIIALDWIEDLTTSKKKGFTSIIFYYFIFDCGLMSFNYKKNTVSPEFILYANHVILICHLNLINTWTDGNNTLHLLYIYLRYISNKTRLYCFSLKTALNAASPASYTTSSP